MSIVDDSFNNKSRDFAETICGKDQKFEKLSNIERELNAQKSKGIPPILINLVGVKYFDSF